MLAAARRDPNFRGIDTDALGQLVKQTTDAANAIQSWLGSHPAPPGVSASGYTAAADVGRWVGNQLGMLTRRRNFALSHPDQGGNLPTTPPPRKLGKTNGSGTPAGTPGSTPGSGQSPAKPRRRIVPAGAGPHLGSYPTTSAAVKAATGDVAAIKKALHDHTLIPASVWQHLRADAKDPDYTRALVEGLGPAGVAGLINAAGNSQTELHEISAALGTASRQMTVTRGWVSSLLTHSAALHDRPTAVKVLTGAPWSVKAKATVGKILSPGHVIPAKIQNPPGGRHKPVRPSHLTKPKVTVPSVEPED